MPYKVLFDEVNDFYAFPDAPELGIDAVDGPQYYWHWLEVPNNSGTLFKYFWSNQSINANNSVNLYLGENSASSGAERRFVMAMDSGANAITAAQANPFPPDRVLVLSGYNGSQKEIIYCFEGDTTVYRATNTWDWDISDSGTRTFNLGRRRDGQSARYYGGYIYNCGKLTTTSGLALTDLDVTNLAADINSFNPSSVGTLDANYPMDEGTGNTITCAVTGRVATGSGFPVDDSEWVFYAGGTGTNVPVTGVSTAGAVGNVTTTGAADTSVTGISTTGAVGNVTVQTDSAILVTGVSTTGAVGNVTATGAADTSVTGISITGTVGNVTVQTDGAIPVTGVATTGAVGIVSTTGAANVTPTGVSATGELGNVTASEANNVAVTGVAATGTVGSITTQEGANTEVTGFQALVELGNITIQTGSATVVTGVSATGEVGNATADETSEVPVTGVSANILLGDVAVEIDTAVQATGVQAIATTSGASVWGIVDENQVPNWSEIPQTNTNWTPFT